MPGPLDRLVSENQSIAGSASVSGSPTPLTPVGAVGVGANQDAAKMAGTPDQKQAAMVRNLRESTPESAQLAFQQAKAPTKGKLAQDLEAARQQAKFAASLAGRVGKLAEEKVVEGIKKSTFPVSDVVNVQNVSASFPGVVDPTGMTNALLDIFNKTDLKPGEYEVRVDQVRKSMRPGEFEKLGRIEGIQAKLFAGKVPTEPEVASRILGNISPELKLDQVTNPSALEAIGGPGYDTSKFYADLGAMTGKTSEQLARMSWGEATTAIKDWQKRSLTDYEELKRLTGSKNPNVQAEAQQRLRELGYFGGESFAAEISSLDPGAAAKIPVAVPGAEKATMDDILQGTELGKQALVTIAGKLQSDPNSLDGVVSPVILDALKQVVTDAKARGTLTETDIAGWKAGEDNLAANERFWTTDAGGGAAGLDTQGLEAVIPGYKDMVKAGGLLSPKDVNNAAFQLFKDPSISQRVRDNLRIAFAGAANTPEVAQALRGMSRDELMSSALVVDPTKVINNLREASIFSDVLRQAQSTGNPETRQLLLTRVFGGTQIDGKDLDQVIKEAVNAGTYTFGNVKLTWNDGRPKTAFELVDEWGSGVGDTASILRGADPLGGLKQELNLAKLNTETTKVVQERKVKQEQDNQDFARYFRAPNAQAKNIVGAARGLTNAFKGNGAILEAAGRVYGALAYEKSGEQSARKWAGKELHNLHKVVLEQGQKIGSAKSQLESMKYALRQNKHPQLQAEIQAVENQIREAEGLLRFMSDLSNAKLPKGPLPTWFVTYQRDRVG